MFYIDEKLLSKLPEDVQALIVKEGSAEPIEDPDMEDMGDEAIEEIKDIESTDEEDLEGVDEEYKLPKPQKYGEEDEFEDDMTSEGGMKDYPESKKNKMTSFQDANERGNALINKVMDAKQFGKKKKAILK